MSVDRVFSALAKVDPGTASFMLTTIGMDELAKSSSEFVEAYGVRLIDALESREERFRKSAVAEYATAVSKSGEPSGRAFELMAAADEAEAIANSLRYELISKGWENWFVGGRNVQRDVKRDKGGRFSRGVDSNAQAGPETGWSFSNQANAWRENNNSGAGATNQEPFIVPDQSAGGANLQQQDGGPMTFTPEVEEADELRTRRWLGQLKTVQELDRELESAFPNDKGDLELNVLVMNTSTNEMDNITLPVGESPALGASVDPSVQNVIEASYQPKSGLSREREAELYQKMVQNQYAQNGYVAPHLLTQLSEVVGGQNGIGSAINNRNQGFEGEGFNQGYGTEGYEGPRGGLPSRLERSMRQWQQVLQTLPGAKPKALAGLLQTMNDGGFHQATDAMRPGVTRASWRFRGNKKEPDPSLRSQVEGFNLSDAEVALFDETVGLERKQPETQQISSDARAGVKEAAEELARSKNMLAQMQTNPPKEGGDPNEREMWEQQIDQLQVDVKRQQAAMNDAMAAGTRAANKPQLSRNKLKQSDVKTSNFAFNGLKRRLNAGQEGVSATQGAQRDAAAMFLLDQRLEQLSGLRQSDLGMKGGGDSTRTNRDRLLSQISSNIGRTFPSEGVLINAKGKIIQQSIGVGDDHYLPFDLPAYKSLIGGSYTRTRSMGGPTVEDLMALIAGGGRAAQVVSPSGVFEVEFDLSKTSPAKLARIPEMYNQILDQVSKGGLYAVDLTPEQNEQIELKLSKRPNYRSMSQADLKTARDAERDAVRREAALVRDVAGKDKEELDRRVEEMSTAAAAAQRRFDPDVARRKAKSELKKEKVRELTINGEGYEVALQTLQRYFPYAIRNVRRDSLRDFVSALNPSEGQGGLNMSSVIAFAESAGEDRNRPGIDFKTGKRKVGTGAGQYGLDFKIPQGLMADSKSNRSGFGSRAKTDQVAADDADRNASGKSGPGAAGGAGAGSSPKSPSSPSGSGGSTIREPDVGGNEKVDSARRAMGDGAYRELGGVFSGFRANSEIEDALSEYKTGPKDSPEEIITNAFKDVVSDDQMPANDRWLLFIGAASNRQSPVRLQAMDAFINNENGLRDALMSTDGIAAYGSIAEAAGQTSGSAIKALEETLIDADFGRLNFVQAETPENPSLDFRNGNSSPVFFNEFTNVNEPEQLNAFVGPNSRPLDGEESSAHDFRKQIAVQADSSDDEGKIQLSNYADLADTLSIIADAAETDPDSFDKSKIASLFPDDPDAGAYAADLIYGTVGAENDDASADSIASKARILADAIVREYSVRWRQASLLWSADPKVRGGSTPQKPVSKEFNPLTDDPVLVAMRLAFQTPM